MTTGVKLLPGYETFILAPVIEVNGEPNVITSTGLVPCSALTAAAINEYQSITSTTPTQAGAGGNISCAILNDMKLGLAASDTDKSKTLCSKGDTQTPTLYKFDAEINLVRDASPTATGLYNLAHSLTRAPDAAYAIIHRVKGGKDSSETFATGDEVDVYYVWTDNPVPGYGDAKYQDDGVKFISRGWVNIGYTLAA